MKSSLQSAMGAMLAGMVLAALTSMAQGAEAWKLPADKPDLAVGPGRELVLGQCILCHSTDYISTQPRLTRPQWQAAVDKMRVRYGAPLSTNLSPAIVEYLTKNYGRP